MWEMCCGTLGSRRNADEFAVYVGGRMSTGGHEKLPCQKLAQFVTPFSTEHLAGVR